MVESAEWAGKGRDRAGVWWEVPNGLGRAGIGHEGPAGVWWKVLNGLGRAGIGQEHARKPRVRREGRSSLVGRAALAHALGAATYLVRLVDGRRGQAAVLSAGEGAAERDGLRAARDGLPWEPEWGVGVPTTIEAMSPPPPHSHDGKGALF